MKDDIFRELTKELSLESKAAQLLMPSLTPKKYAESEEYRERCTALIELGVGGFCVFQGEVEQTAQILAELQAQADIPLLFSADYEHGLPMRLEGGTDFPHAMALGKGGDVALTRRIASAIAKEARGIGIHWNFAPVCDVNSNKLNPIINTRAFGEGIGEVIPHALAYIEGTQEEKVIACAKHFPGHGDTATDSHIAMPVLQHSRERLASVELVPFLSAVRAGVKSLMVAHLAVPSFDESNTPASLSPLLIKGLLRKQFRYNGVIVTDALDMHAISHHYSSAEATLNAITAGCDVALVPENPFEAVTALRQAASNGALTEERIHESLRRVMELKEWCGLFERKAHRQELISLEEHGMLALKAAMNAVRIHGDESLLPLERYNHIAAFALLGDDSEKAMDDASEFFHYLAQVYEKDSDLAYVSAAISDEEIQEYITGTQSAECFVFAVFARARGYAGTVQIHERLRYAAEHIAGDKPVIALLFGNPYLDESFPADVYVKCYSDSKPSRGAACLAITKKSISV